jgi:hypothetical protein
MRIRRAKGERSLVCSDPVRFTAALRPAVSQNPAPTVFPEALCIREMDFLEPPLQTERRVMSAFWREIEYVSSAPLLQLLDRGGYNESARANRERIAQGRR